MAILNYSTTVDAIKTVGEVEYILIKHGAKSILKDIGNDSSISGLSFIVETPYGPMQIRMPVNKEPVLEVLKRQKQKKVRHQSYAGTGRTGGMAYFKRLDRSADGVSRSRNG